MKPAHRMRSITLNGKMSTFGGPKDTGVSPSEGLALWEPAEIKGSSIELFFLPTQPKGTTGLARRLDPDKFYLAMRWDYAVTPKTHLQKISVRVTANGRSCLARPVDWGPNIRTRRIADLSPGLAKALGLATDDTITVEIPLP